MSSGSRPCRRRRKSAPRRAPPIRLGMPYTCDGELRHGGPDDDGGRAGRAGRAVRCVRAAPLAFGANCGVGASDLVMSILAMTQARPEAVVDRQGQCRHSAMAWRAYSLFRHAGTDGRLCGPRDRRGRAHRRRLLRFDPDASGRHASRDRRACGGRGPTSADVVAALGPLAAPPAAAEGQTRTRRGFDAPGELEGQTARLDASERGDSRSRARRGAARGCRRLPWTASVEPPLSGAAGARRLALSRTRLKALIEAGYVTVDGQVVATPPPRLIAGARIEVEAPPPRRIAAARAGSAARHRVRGPAPARARQAGRPRRPSRRRA